MNDRLWITDFSGLSCWTTTSGSSLSVSPMLFRCRISVSMTTCNLLCNCYCLYQTEIINSRKLLLLPPPHLCALMLQSVAIRNGILIMATNWWTDGHSSFYGILNCWWKAARTPLDGTPLKERSIDPFFFQNLNLESAVLPEYRILECVVINDAGCRKYDRRPTKFLFLLLNLYMPYLILFFCVLNFFSPLTPQIFFLGTKNCCLVLKKDSVRPTLLQFDLLHYASYGLLFASAKWRISSWRSGVRFQRPNIP